MRNDKRIFLRTMLSIGIIMVFSCLVSGLVFSKTRIEPNLSELGKTQARSIAAKIANDSVMEVVSGDISFEKMLKVSRDKQGNITMVQTDTGEINRISSEIIGNIQSDYEKNPVRYTRVALGTVLGSSLLSETGPSVKIGIQPLAVSGITFKTEMKDAGINQTKYKIYAVVRSRIKVLIPFSTEEVEVKDTILVAEAVIVGDVPQSYINVPEDEVLNVVE